MDEPLSNLDAKLRVQMRADIAALQARLGVTTVYVTHDQAEAMTLGHRVAVLRDATAAAVRHAAGAVRPAGEHVRGRLRRLAGDEPLPACRSADGQAAFGGACRSSGRACARTGATEVIVGVRPEAMELADEGLDAERRGRRRARLGRVRLLQRRSCPAGAVRLVARVDRAARARARRARARCGRAPDTSPHVFDPADAGERLWHRSATPPLLRDLNERTVLETIRAGAPISRAEISRHVRASRSRRCRWRCESLLEAGLVREADNDAAGPEVRRDVLRAGPRGGARARARPRRALPARRDLRPARRGARAAGRRAAAAPTSTPCSTRRPSCATASSAAADLPADALDGAVAGVPGVVESPSGAGRARRATSRGSRGCGSAPELQARLGVPVTVENDVNLAAVGEQSRGVAHGRRGLRRSCPSAPASAPGSCSRGELHRGHHGAAGEVDYALGGGLEARRRPGGRRRLRLRRARSPPRAGCATALAPPFDVRAIFGAARAGDELARAVVAEEARRIAAPRRPDRGGGRRRARRPRRRHRRERRPAARPDPRAARASAARTRRASRSRASATPPCSPGALAVGLRSALDNVFTRRSRAARA